MMENTKLIYLINLFKAEFPQGFQSLDGYSREGFDDEVLSMSCRAGLIKFINYTATNKPLLEPEDKQQKIVAAVSHLGVELTAKNCMFCNAGEKYISRSNGELKYLALEKKADDTICSISIEEFNQCVKEMSNHAGGHAFSDYVDAVKTPLQHEAKKTVVDAVNILEGHWYFASESGLLSLDDESESFWCDKIGFNQCVTDLTGCPLKHAAWLAALNDMREGELKNSVHTGGNKTIDWQNGDQCVHKGGECFFVGMMPIQQKHYADGLDCFVQHKNGCPLIVNSSMLSKPESPEQKAEREREELTSEIFDELAGKSPIEVATYLADYELSGK